MHLYDFVDFRDASIFCLYGVDIGPRSEILLELYDPSTYPWNESLTAYRMGDFKLIKGTVRGDNYVREAVYGRDGINIASKTLMEHFAEFFVRVFEAIFGIAQFDSYRITFIHTQFMTAASKTQWSNTENTVRLFNIRVDPLEETNLANEPYAMGIVDSIEKKVRGIRQLLPHQQEVWLQYHLDKEWVHTFVPGDCSMNKDISAQECRFTHPWISDVRL
jgi:hypothetical protein